MTINDKLLLYYPVSKGESSVTTPLQRFASMRVQYVRGVVMNTAPISGGSHEHRPFIRGMEASSAAATNRGWNILPRWLYPVTEPMWTQNVAFFHFSVILDRNEFNLVFGSNHAQWYPVLCHPN